MDSHTLDAARAAIALLTMTASSVPSVAFAGEVVRTEHVRIADLNLQTDKGVGALDRRLSRTIARLCHIDDHWTGGPSLDEMRCRRDAKMNVRSQRNLAIKFAGDPQSRLAKADDSLQVLDPARSSR
jgi:UrcA family protein